MDAAESKLSSSLLRMNGTTPAKSRRQMHGFLSFFSCTCEWCLMRFMDFLCAIPAESGAAKPLAAFVRWHFLA